MTYCRSNAYAGAVHAVPDFQVILDGQWGMFHGTSLCGIKNRWAEKGYMEATCRACKKIESGKRR